MGKLFGVKIAEKMLSMTAMLAKVFLVCVGNPFSDPDDQKFIDLAVAHQALLLSKDQHLLVMRKRLLAQGIHA